MCVCVCAQQQQLKSALTLLPTCAGRIDIIRSTCGVCDEVADGLCVGGRERFEERVEREGK